MFYSYHYNLYPYYSYPQYFYNYFYSPFSLEPINLYRYSSKGILRPQQHQFYRELSIKYITDWFSGKYDEYKKYLFKCFYKYPYEFEKIKKCLQEEYNVPKSMAENMTKMVQYGYETSGWASKRLSLNKLSGEWKTNLGMLKLYISEDLVPTDDTIFPYANKVTGSYDWDGGGRIEGSVNWGGASSGVIIGPNVQGEFEIKFEKDSSGKRTFKGAFTENDENHDWEGEQISEY
ncbi:hypothetical protein R9X47_12175 [Wukongibacter baidiensis]|uniref:hypothetical protein n=1 Tax=Wukongibacter baidiensis TaxID=1723361 RepID=UPI003D7FD7B0